MNISTVKEGAEVLAYGYEAVARGALEAGVRVVAGFPGNPASGALRTLASVSREENIHVQWSTNEKVAFEVAWGAAMSGQRALCSVNQLGTNTLVDPLRFSANYGVRGGLVLFAGDDIGGNTSGIEADSRPIGDAADIPILEPADGQEARLMVPYCFELSEKLGVAVMLRSGCQVMMGRSTIKVGKVEKPIRTSQFGMPERTLPFELTIRRTALVHRFLHSNLDKAQGILSDAPFDRIEPKSGAKVGIIAVGVGYSLTQEALRVLDVTDRVAVLKLGVVHPLNEELVKSFLSSVDVALVVEEGEPYAELRIQAIAGRAKLGVQILGRYTETFAYGGEQLIPNIVNAIKKALAAAGQAVPEHAAFAPLTTSGLMRNPSLCAGCPHLGTYYALKQATDEVTGGRNLAFADAGCSWMGTLPHSRIFKIATDMGGAIGLATGAALAGCEGPVIAVVGDGGFLHSGLPSLANACHHEIPLVVLLLDNRTLANTGLQAPANASVDAAGNAARPVDLPGLCREAGARFVESMNPLHPEEAIATIKRALLAPKPAVVIACEPCTLVRLREQTGGTVSPVRAAIAADTCTACGVCMELHCPAIVWEKKQGQDDSSKPAILTDICSGCGLCAEVCGPNAIAIKEIVA